MASDQIIGVGVDEIETWTSTPVTQKATFDMLCFERLGEKPVVLQEYLCRSTTLMLNHIVRITWDYFDNACSLTDNWLPSGKQ